MQVFLLNYIAAHKGKSRKHRGILKVKSREKTEARLQLKFHQNISRRKSKPVLYKNKPIYLEVRRPLSGPLPHPPESQSREPSLLSLSLSFLFRISGRPIFLSISDYDVLLLSLRILEADFDFSLFLSL